MRRIAVIGASGFVGSSLVEALRTRGDDEVVTFIHSSGNAWRLARLGIELRMLDLLDASQVDSALRGVTHVVNCARGGDDVMLTGLRNLIVACRMHRVERLVHLGSVAVYGDPPPPESEREDARTEPIRKSYGWVKLKQDRMVMRACREGLRAWILCPPNISGPYSAYLLGLVDTLRAGAFALLEDGSAPCNLVDVYNLVRAIELALVEGPADGTRLFVTDDEPTTWRDVVENLLPLVEAASEPPSVAREELARHSDAGEKPRGGVFRSVKHLGSSDVRQALRKDPVWRSIDTALRRAVARMGGRIENVLRDALEGPVRVTKVNQAIPLNMQLCRQQLRGVRHSCALAKERLGYRPIHTFAQSMRAYRSWYRANLGMDSDEWPLLRQLVP